MNGKFLMFDFVFQILHWNVSIHLKLLVFRNFLRLVGYCVYLDWEITIDSRKLIFEQTKFSTQAFTIIPNERSALFTWRDKGLSFTLSLLNVNVLQFALGQSNLFLSLSRILGNSTNVSTQETNNASTPIRKTESQICTFLLTTFHKSDRLKFVFNQSTSKAICRFSTLRKRGKKTRTNKVTLLQSITN